MIALGLGLLFILGVVFCLAACVVSGDQEG